MLLKELFNFAGINVKASRDDEVALASTERAIAIVRDRSQVTGAEPTVGERFARGGFASPVAAEDIRASQVDFAVGQFRRNTGERESDGSGTPLPHVRI